MWLWHLFLPFYLKIYFFSKPIVFIVLWKSYQKISWGYIQYISFYLKNKIVFPNVSITYNIFDCAHIAKSGHWPLPFLTVRHSPFHKNETLESWHNWLMSNWSRLLNWKGPRTWPQFSKSFKRFLKMSLSISINRPSLVT